VPIITVLGLSYPLSYLLISFEGEQHRASSPMTPLPTVLPLIG
jgi:hypothetical protein